MAKENRKLAVKCCDVSSLVFFKISDKEVKKVKWVKAENREAHNCRAVSDSDTGKVPGK